MSGGEQFLEENIREWISKSRQPPGGAGGEGGGARIVRYPALLPVGPAGKTGGSLDCPERCVLGEGAIPQQHAQELLPGPRFDLADHFTRNSELLPDFLQGQAPAASQSEPLRKNLVFPCIEAANGPQHPDAVLLAEERLFRIIGPKVRQKVFRNSSPRPV